MKLGEAGGVLGMILKGYPRISESFISSEILLLESLGLPVEIYSLRQPRESFAHEHVKRIKANVTYLPEYVLPNWRALLDSNRRLGRRLGGRYARCLAGAVRRAVERRGTATLRHFLQAGHLAETRLTGSPVTHIHAHFCHTPASVAFFASELTGLPFSFTAHAKDIYISEPEQLVRKLLKAKFVVTCTRYNARYLEGLVAGRRAAPIHTVYHGIDIGYFSFSEPPPPGPPYKILSVGRLVAKKGYDDLLRALQLLARSGVDFQFDHIGSGEEEASVRHMVSELGLSDRVRWLGTLPHSEVIGHYRSAHCFALACKIAANGDRDGIPNVLIEAMAVGVPVIATRVSAIPELVEDGVTGTLVEPERPEAMRDALRRALLSPGECLSMTGRARKKVQEEFESRRCVLNLYDLLKEAVRPGP